MEKKTKERRVCERFKLQDAAVSYSLKKGVFFKKTHDGKYPVVEMSRGGIRFYDQKPLKIDKEVVINLFIPGNEDPLTLKGKVVWSSFSENAAYKYQNGVQFYPFGPEKGFNPPAALDQIINLEQETDKTEEE